VSIVFVARDLLPYASFIARLRQEQEVTLLAVETGAEGLTQLASKRPQVVIAAEHFSDMSGIDFIKRLVAVNPLANTAIVGAAPAEVFHELTEGLGVLMQLPRHPGEEDAESLLAVLAKIASLMQPAKGEGVL
jgi:CheY-like chemotaxis protein